MVRGMRDALARAAFAVLVGMMALAIAIEEMPAATFWRRILVPWALVLMTIVALVLVDMRQ